jgi:hypothetical protein
MDLEYSKGSSKSWLLMDGSNSIWEIVASQRKGVRPVAWQGAWHVIPKISSTCSLHLEPKSASELELSACTMTVHGIRKATVGQVCTLKMQIQ